jgi:hypothetical protein
LRFEFGTFFGETESACYPQSKIGAIFVMSTLCGKECRRTWQNAHQYNFSIHVNRHKHHVRPIYWSPEKTRTSGVTSGNCGSMNFPHRCCSRLISSFGYLLVIYIYDIGTIQYFVHNHLCKTFHSSQEE